MASSERVVRLASLYFSGTMLSRFSGLFRDIAMAFFFGASPAVAGFMVAYRLAFLFRRLFGEGLLSQGFIPHFEAVRQASSRRALEFFRDVFFSMALCLGGVLLVVGAAFFIWGRGEISLLTIFILPGVLWICLYGLTMSFLQANSRFFLSAVAPALANIMWALGCFAVSILPVHTGLRALAGIVSLGFFLQWAVIWKQARPLLRAEPIQWWQPKLFSLEFRKLVAPLFLGVIGVAAVQVNSAVDAIFARMASLEGPAYLWYAIRIEQLPLALIGLAFSSALLPELSRLLEKKEQESFNHLVAKSLRQVFAIIFPCTVALFILAPTGINLLYGRGDFSVSDMFATTECLWGYGWGLLPSALVQLIAPVFYARKDFRTPAFGFALSALLNILLDAVLVMGAQMGPVSIALSTSLATLFNLVYLAFHLRRREIPFLNFQSLFKTSSCALLAAAVAVYLGHLLWADPFLPMLLHAPLAISSHFTGQAVQFGLQSATFLISFGVLCYFAKEKVLISLFRSSAL
jgi:putative peptidoglycan lipid II flippase